LVSVCEVVSRDGTTIGDVIDVVAMETEKLGTICTNGCCSPAVGERSVDHTGTYQDYNITSLNSPSSPYQGTMDLQPFPRSPGGPAHFRTS